MLVYGNCSTMGVYPVTKLRNPSCGEVLKENLALWSLAPRSKSLKQFSTRHLDFKRYFLLCSLYSSDSFQGPISIRWKEEESGEIQKRGELTTLQELKSYYLLFTLELKSGGTSKMFCWIHWIMYPVTFFGVTPWRWWFG